MFLQSEIELINSLFAPLWNSLDSLKENYYEEVLSSSFYDVSRKIGEVINIRYTLMAKYARCTTKRLQGIRALPPVNLQLKKAAVTRQQLTTFLSARTHPITEFVTELVAMIPETHLVQAARGLDTPDVHTKRSAKSAIQAAAIRVYLESAEAKEYKIDRPDDGELDEKVVGQIARALSSYKTKIAAIESIVRREEKFLGQVLGKLTNLIGLNSNAQQEYDILMRHKEAPEYAMLSNYLGHNILGADRLRNDWSLTKKAMNLWLGRVEDFVKKHPDSELKSQVSDALKRIVAF